MHQPYPAEIRNAPEVFFGLELFFTAFWDLNSERQMGWGVGPIPFTSILEYADRHGIYGEQLDDLVFYVKAMDSAYLEREAKKMKDK